MKGSARLVPIDSEGGRWSEQLWLRREQTTPRIHVDRDQGITGEKNPVRIAKQTNMPRRMSGCDQPLPAGGSRNFVLMQFMKPIAKIPESSRQKTGKESSRSADSR